VFLRADNVVGDVNSNGVPFVIGEGNSVSCGGMPGVSNSFASALWSIDMLFNVAAVGIDHFNFHGGGSSTESYSAFVYRNGTKDPTPVVQPLYYGLRLFAEATRDEFQIVNTTIHNTTNSMIKVHSGYTRENSVHFVIAHKDLNATDLATVTLIVPAGARDYPDAEVYRLSAPNAASEFGLNFAGQTYDNTKDGFPSGTIQPEIVPPASARVGVYRISVKPISAVLVRVRLGSTIL